MDAQSLWPNVGLEQLFDLEYLEARLHAAEAWLASQVFVSTTLMQLLIIGMAYLAAPTSHPGCGRWSSSRLAAAGSKIASERRRRPWCL